MINDTWLPVMEFPIYEVSDTGKIRRVSTKRVLKPYLAGAGRHPQITLCIPKEGGGSVVKRRYLHRLVAAAWMIGFIPERSVVFVNGDKTNAAIWNLTQDGDNVRTHNI